MPKSNRARASMSKRGSIGRQQIDLPAPRPDALWQLYFDETNVREIRQF